MDINKIERVTLSNGVRVLMLPNSNNRSACVSAWIGSGSRFEDPKRSGVSHFIEHMLFKGTARRDARTIAEEMDAIGSQFNAYTTNEYTCVYARALDSHLPNALDLVADIVTSPRLDPDDMELERGVILEEIGMYEDSPEDLLLDAAHEVLWQGDMLGTNILGTRDTVTSMTTDDLRAHMAEQYAAQRVVLSVSGAFDRDSFLEQAERQFGVLPTGSVPFAAKPAQYKRGTRLIKKDFEQNHICLVFPAVSMNDERRYAFNILHSICGGGSSSRLYQRIREELGLAYSVGSMLTTYMCEGMFSTDAAVSPSNDIEALHEMVSELCRLKRDGVTEQEFIRAREQAKASIVMGLEGNSAISAHMGRSELVRGCISSEDELLSRYDNVTLSQVNDIAREFINFDNFSLCAVGKVKSEKVYNGVVQSAIF